MRSEDPRQLADELEREARDMERSSGQVGEAASAAREDWQRKRADDDVPGAVRPERGEQEAASEERSPPPEAPPEGEES